MAQTASSQLGPGLHSRVHLTVNRAQIAGRRDQQGSGGSCRDTRVVPGVLGVLAGGVLSDSHRLRRSRIFVHSEIVRGGRVGRASILDHAPIVTA